MAGLRTPISITGTFTPESALVKNADGSAITNPVYQDCVYDSALGKWLCSNEAPNGYYGPGSQQFRLKGSSPLVIAYSQNGETVNGGGTTPITPASPTWSLDAALRILSLTAPTGYVGADLEYSHDAGSSYGAYTAGLSLDGNAHNAGEWLGRVKSASGRNPSPPAPSPVVAAAPPATSLAVVLATDKDFLTQGQTVTLTAAVSGASGGVSKVEFYDGTTKLNTDTSSPYTYAYTPGSTGLKSLKAVATDGSTATAISAVKQVSVTPSTEVYQQVANGDSLVTEYPTTFDVGPDSFPAILQNSLDPAFWNPAAGGVYGYGYPSQPIEVIQTHLSDLLALRRPSTTKFFVDVRAGVNNMALSSVNDTGEQAFAKLVTFCQAIFDGGGIPIVATTTIARGGSSIAGYPNIPYTQLDARQAVYNNLIRTNMAQLHCPVVADLASDYRLASKAYGYQVDGIHETVAGRAIVAEIFLRALQAASAGQTGVIVQGQPTPAASTDPETATVLAFNDPALHYVGNFAFGSDFGASAATATNANVEIAFTRGIALPMTHAGFDGVLNAIWLDGIRQPDVAQVAGQNTFEIHGLSGSHVLQIGKSEAAAPGEYLVFTGAITYS